MVESERLNASAKRGTAAAKYKPSDVKLLLVAETPPMALDRYFYFEDVTGDDWLFRYVICGLFGALPGRHEKREYLERLQKSGLFMIDLKEDPFDGRTFKDCVPDLVHRALALAPAAVILIKVNVYDEAFESMREAGLPVVDQRIAFPSTGRQKDFLAGFESALEQKGIQM